MADDRIIMRRIDVDRTDRRAVVLDYGVSSLRMVSTNSDLLYVYKKHQLVPRRIRFQIADRTRVQRALANIGYIPEKRLPEVEWWRKQLQSKGLRRGRLKDRSKPGAILFIVAIVAFYLAAAVRYGVFHKL